MGFKGTSVTAHVRQLIEEYHVGTILLASQNLSCEQFLAIITITLHYTYLIEQLLDKQPL